MSRYAHLNRFNKSCLCLALSFLFAAPVSFAESGVSIFQQVSGYEEILFGKADTGTQLDKRLQKLEKELFGKNADKNDSPKERITAIEKVMSGKTGSLYLPPVAPELDRSEFAPLPKQAPSNPGLQENSVYNDLDAPQPADRADKVKGLLRQALKNYSDGNTQDAERLFKQVLALDFRNADANYNLAAIAESKGELSQAKNYYTAALKASPGDLEIQDAINSINDRLSKENKVLSKTPAPVPSSRLSAPVTAQDRAIAQEAATAYKNGNFDDAISKLGYLAKKNPLDANTQFALGQAYRGKGKEQDALRHLRSAATLDPKNDLYVKSLSDLQSQVDEKQLASSGSSAGAEARSNDVTPFVGLPKDGSNSAPSIAGVRSVSDMAAVEAYLRRNAGNVMIGSVTYGRPGFSGNSIYGNSMPMTFGSMPGSTRLKRALGSTLQGAAVGALQNRSYPGGMSRGAMRGAMYGGLYGLMMGGY